jgi:hypothetical protein
MKSHSLIVLRKILDKFKILPKDKIIRLPKNSHSIVDRCYEKRSLKEWCSQDKFRGTGTCDNPTDRQDLFLSHPTEMNNLMLYNENKDKDKYFKEDEVVVGPEIPY